MKTAFTILILALVVLPAWGQEDGGKALLADPLVKAHPILYVARTQYPGGHHNTETMFQSDEPNAGKFRHNAGGKLKLLTVADGKVKILVDPGPTGCVRDPDVSYDGKKVLFSMRKDLKDDYHIYEVNADGSGLRQLTCLPGCFDIDPVYLPDGDIIFTSSRDPKYCMCNMHIMGNLFRMDGDGANIHQVGRSTLFEGHAAVMPDGRILYDRWEYVDRNFGDAQGLWTMNPDGTAHAIYWGNNTGSPGGVIDARMVPGTPYCIATLTSCHDRPWGAIGIIDRRKGVDGAAAVLRTWPASAKKLVNERGSFDAFKRVTPHYEDPYPLSDTIFMASRETRPREKMAICLLDMAGNEAILHEEEKMGCYDPMPLAPRKRPPVHPLKRDYKNQNGIFYVQNVMIGTHMQGIAEGEVKYLRVVESPPKRNWTGPAWGGQGVHKPAMNWHNFENKRILGTVPVETDGSAHFECPSDRFVFFQLLDKDGRMLQSMRSGTIIQSGETQGCVGCHEDRVKDAPPMTRQPLALRRKPSKLNGWLGPARLFSYQQEVQPVFDSHCVKCHDYGKPASKSINLAGDRTLAFNTSYTDLWSSGTIRCVGGGPAAIQQPKTWGSHASKLIQVLLSGHDEHKDLRLPREALHRLITWVDLNAPYYPTYDTAYPNGAAGRSPLDDKSFNRLKQLTRAPFVLKHGRGKTAQVCFERPETSLCLTRLEKGSAAYTEALAIIRKGAAQLQATPRADMTGFKPCAKDCQRNRKAAALQEVENRFRKALDEGRKLYDKDVLDLFAARR